MSSIPSRGRKVAALLRRDGRACWWCKKILPDGYITVDHVIPLRLAWRYPEEFASLIDEERERDRISERRWTAS